MQGIAAFDAMDINTKRTVCEAVTYLSKKEGDVIQTPKEFCAWVFVILQGRVQVGCDGHRVCTLRNGELLGNVEMQLGKRTILSAVALDDVRLLAVHRNIYMKYWPHKELELSRVNFLKKLPGGFASFRSHLLVLLNYLLVERNVRKGDVLARQHDRCTRIAVLQSGECTAFRQLDVPTPKVDQYGRVVPQHTGRKQTRARNSVSQAAVVGDVDSQSNVSAVVANIALLGGVLPVETQPQQDTKKSYNKTEGAGKSPPSRATRSGTRGARHRGRTLDPMLVVPSEVRRAFVSAQADRVVEVAVAKLGQCSTFGAVKFHEHTIKASTASVTLVELHKESAADTLSAYPSVITAFRELVSIAGNWRRTRAESLHATMAASTRPPIPAAGTISAKPPRPHSALPETAARAHSAAQRRVARSMSSAIEISHTIETANADNLSKDAPPAPKFTRRASHAESSTKVCMQSR